MPTLEVEVYQSKKSDNAHSSLRYEIVNLIEDTIARWDGVSSSVSAEDNINDPPSEETDHSGEGYICANHYDRWDNLAEWWQSLCSATPCVDNVAADSNILITNGPADAPSGWGFGGGQYAVVELGPCTDPDWTYDGTKESSDNQFRYAMNAVHEMGHNLKIDHRYGRLDPNGDDTYDETPMMNFYGDDAINNDWTLKCDDSVPNDQPPDWYSRNDFSQCEKDKVENDYF